MNLVDSHCHLDHEQFAGDLERVIDRARDAGVTRMLSIGTGEGPPDLECAIRLAQSWPGVAATVGVHPHYAAKATPRTFDQLRELLRLPNVVALGEIGLDYHYDFSPREAQQEIFREQLRLAAECGKPIVIHTREAWADTLELLPGHRGIMHCFTGGPEEARQALQLGFYLAFGGVLTFPKSEKVREAARLVPLDRLLLETDAPYLAPVPHRGKRNEPAFVGETARKLAEIRGISLEEIAAATTQNFDTVIASPAGTLI